MKKVYVTLALACMSIGAMAQVKVGPKVGLNMTKISDGEKTGEGVKEPYTLGLNLGVAFSLPVSESFSIAPEITFSQKGAVLKGEFEDIIGTETFSGSMKNTLRLNYLDIPVLARIAFGESTKGYLNVGPTLGYWLGGYDKITVELNGEKESEKQKMVFVDEGYEAKENELSINKKNANRLEVGASAGGGVMFDTSAGSLMLDLRYNVGLTNMFDYDDADDRIMKNHGASLSLIYLIGSK